MLGGLTIDYLQIEDVFLVPVIPVIWTNVEILSAFLVIMVAISVQHNRRYSRSNR